MRNLLTLLAAFVFFVPFFAAADAPADTDPSRIQLTCMTEFPTTSYQIQASGGELVARIVHHNGAKYAPAISGIYTFNDLETLARRAKAVTKMNDDMTFRWPLEKCKRHDEFRFECFGTDDVQEGRGGAKIAPFAVYTTQVTEQGIAGKYEYMLVTLSFNVDGERDATVEMKYLKEGCVPFVRKLPND